MAPPPLLLLPYSFGLDRTTTGRGAVARNSPIPLVSPAALSPSGYPRVPSRSREFFDPFYGVCSVRIIYPLNYISIPSLAPPSSCCSLPGRSSVALALDASIALSCKRVCANARDYARSLLILSCSFRYSARNK